MLEDKVLRSLENWFEPSPTPGLPIELSASQTKAAMDVIAAARQLLAAWLNSTSVAPRTHALQDAFEVWDAIEGSLGGKHA